MKRGQATDPRRTAVPRQQPGASERPGSVQGAPAHRALMDGIRAAPSALDSTPCPRGIQERNRARCAGRRV